VVNEMSALQQRDEARLAELLSEVHRTRADLRAARHSPKSSVSAADQRVLCAALAEAMEAYANAAAEVGLPVPDRYAEELRLFRSVAAG